MQEIGTLKFGRPERPFKFIFFPLSHVIAHLSRCLETARILRDRGHEAIFAAEAPDHPRSKMRFVREAGFRIVPVREPDHPYVWTRYMRHGALSLTYDMTQPNRWAPGEAILESQVRAIKDEAPDAVIGAASVGLSTAAHIARVPVALVGNAYLFDYYLSRCYYRALRTGYDRFYYASGRKRVYQRFGVEPGDPLALFMSAPLFSPDLPGLYTVSPWMAHAHTIGPITFNLPAPLPEWFGQLDDGRENIYLTLGSTGRGDTFLPRAFKLLGRLPYRFVVTTGGQASADTLKAAPPNFLITDYAPGDDLLRRCTAMIYQGGNGSMYQGLHAGVPMLAVPMHDEQVMNARIAESNGFGTTLRLRAASGKALVPALETLLGEPRFREAAQRIGAEVRASDGAATLATHLEEVAARAVPSGALL